MADDDSTKPLLERLCALQEEQLALTRQSLERHEERVQRQEKSQELWERQLTLHEQHQKTYDERAERHEREVRIRGVIMLIIWATIAIAVIVHYFF
jgi:uncharacterized protein YcbX